MKQISRHLSTSIFALLLLSCTKPTTGDVFSDNPEEAGKTESRFREACASGQSSSCLELGMFFRIQALKQDRANRGSGLATSTDFFKLGCDLENYEACRMLASSYYGGEGVTRDRDNAFGYYEKACKGDNAAACDFIGTAYNHGLHVQKDPERGLEFTDKACRLGERAACRSLHSYRLRQCNAGRGEDCIKAAEMYENGRGLAVDMNENARSQNAAEILQKACDLGVSVKCN